MGIRRARTEVALEKTLEGIKEEELEKYLSADRQDLDSDKQISAGEGSISPTNMQVMVFGYELLLDLYDCKPGVCDDITLCYKFLDEIVTYLRMEKQSPPYIFRSDGVRFPDKAGLSGWAPLIESSIVIHTLTPKNFISIDIYCCKEFDTQKAKEFVKSFFLPKRIDERFLERGIDYYK